MKFYSNLLCGAVFAAVILPAMANVATTAGSNLTAYNGTGAMNNNQWNSLMNGRAGMSQNAAEANFGNCNAIVLRCASPKCASGGCTDMNVATAIVAGCVNSNQTCKQYGDECYLKAEAVCLEEEGRSKGIGKGKFIDPGVVTVCRRKEDQYYQGHYCSCCKKEAAEHV